ncbi:RNA methyltransferase [bacterium]|nr:RNA methyltransferase [bacterium]|tara:strand:+ start:198 stop:662 length:465 start_codon:yes stop_codon:yes gene_type:complete
MAKRLFLNNIRSAHNVGAMFRTADGAGVERVYLGGYTPNPIDRFNRVQPEIMKTSLGACETVGWEHVKRGDEVAALQKLQADGCTVVAVEQTPESISMYDYTVPKEVVYVLGNEIDGVEAAILEIADVVIEIPMEGAKESLNVATTAGIVLFTR